MARNANLDDAEKAYAAASAEVKPAAKRATLCVINKIRHLA